MSDSDDRDRAQPQRSSAGGLHHLAGWIRRTPVNPIKIAAIATSLVLFILSLQLIQEGASSAGNLVRTTFNVNSALDAFGFGWLLSYLVLSGSPVAAVSLVFLDDGAISNLESYAMIAGSRMGASLIVLLLGFLYVLRGHESRASLSAGMLAFIVSATIQAPAFLLGYIALRAEWLNWIQFEFTAVNVLRRVFEPAVNAVSALLPDWGVFIVGIALIIGTFNLFDRGLPDPGIGRRGFGATPSLVYRPPVMFALGIVVTLLTLSVSVSLGVLVPLSARGIIRRENLIPYIMGCNVSTLIDTLLVAVLLQSNDGFTVVIVGMLSLALVSVATLVAGFALYERGIVRVVDWSLSRSMNIGIVIGVLVIVPLVLVLF